MAHVLDAYARRVTAGTLPAGKLHRLACARHEADRRRERAVDFPYRFDATRADLAIKFFGRLKHYKGEWAGSPIVLEPWQAFIIGSVFGWVSRETGFRRFRKAYNEVPRKNGKSLLSAGLILYGTFFDHEPGAEAYCAATKRDQAKIVFGDCKRLVQSSGLKSRIAVHVGNLYREDTASKLEPLSADHDSMDGLNVHMCVLDEFHAQKDRGIIDVIETAMGARRQPLLFAITTAGADPFSPCGEEHEYAEKILNGVITDDTFFAFIAHADEGDDPFAVATQKKANPNYGVSVKPEDLQALAQKAKHMPSALATFKQKRLDMWINTATPWLDLEQWKAGQTDSATWDLAGRPCAVALDLASKIDLAAVAAIFSPMAEGEPWRLQLWFFTCEDELDERAKSYRVPLRRWVEQGYVRVNPGARIDQSAIKACLLDEIARTYAVQWVGYDPWNIGNLAVDLQDTLGEHKVVEVPQNMTQLSEPSKEFEAEVGAGRMDAGHNPVMTWMVSNAVVDMDGNGNIKPTKNPKKMRGRIDGVVAAVMALKLARFPPEPDSIYLTRGVRELG